VRQNQDKSVAVGVIGVGNMGSALVQGWLRTGQSRINLLLWDKVEELAHRMAESSSHSLTAGPTVRAAGSWEDVVAHSEILFLVVKPKDASGLLGLLRDRLASRQTVVSAMAGLPLSWMRSVLGPGPSLLRIMPNLAVRLGAGVLAVTAEPGTSRRTVEQVLELVKPLGVVRLVSEEELGVVTALSGSGPGFLAVMMEALEDGAVAAGLSRRVARVLVRQAAKELAQRLCEGGDSAAATGALLAEAGSPAAQGLALLEERGVREAFAAAVRAALERSRSLAAAG